MRPKVLVSYPVGGSVTRIFAHSIKQLLIHEAEKPFAWLSAQMLDAANAGRVIQPVQVRRMLAQALDQSLLVQVIDCSSLYIADNRTALVQRFLKGGHDWLLQIDTDIEFPVTLLESLLRLAGDDKKILAASVPLGDDQTCAYLKTDRPGVYGNMATVPMTPIQVDAIATPCVLIHREVFEAMADLNGQNWFHHKYLPENLSPEQVHLFVMTGTLPDGMRLRDVKYISQGEDLAFSARAREAGYAIWCVHLPGLKHYKTKPLSHDVDLARGLALANEGGAMGELVAEG